MRFLASSLAVHALIIGGVALAVFRERGHVLGAAGLAGPTETRFGFTLDAPSSRSASSEVHTSTEPISLPAEVKNQNPRLIETHPSDPSPNSDGNGETGAIGRAGQGGDGSDRMNRLGLYLQRMRQKIQSNLGPAGYLAFPASSLLRLDLNKEGGVTKITVVRSSGSTALDRLAIRAVENSIPFDGWESDHVVEVPLVFRATE